MDELMIEEDLSGEYIKTKVIKFRWVLCAAMQGSVSM